MRLGLSGPQQAVTCAVRQLACGFETPPMSLDAFLKPLGLQSTLAIFEGEELTLEVLM